MARYIIIDMDMPNEYGVVWVLHTDGKPLALSPQEIDTEFLSEDALVYKNTKLKLEECNITQLSKIIKISGNFNVQTQKYIEVVKEIGNEN